MAACSVDEGRTMDIVYLNFSNAFNAGSHRILTDKLLMYRLHEETVRWIEKQLNGQARNVEISGTRSSWRPVTMGSNPSKHLH